MMNQLQTQETRIKTFQTSTGEVKLSPQIVKQYLVNGNGSVTDQEITYFIALCSGRGLNPFVKDAYLIKYGNSPATTIVSKDAIMRRATTHPDFDGLEFGLIVIKKETQEIEYKKGAFYNEKIEEIAGAWATVHRKSWKLPVSAEVNFREYAGRTKDGQLNSMWSTKGATMITKVAKVHALREAFVEDLSGCYDESEMDLPVNNVVATFSEKTEAQQNLQAITQSEGDVF